MKNYTTYAVRVYKDGAIEYRKKDKLHRLGGPAVECANGDKLWYFGGKLHRIDGPAVERVDGTKFWYVDGKSHRLDGPAVEYHCGVKEWYVDNKLHRLDGPAVEYPNCYKAWYIDGKEYTEKKFAEVKKLLTKDSCDGKIIEVDGKKYKLVAE